VRIAVAVDDQRGLESACSASLEAAACWVVVELAGGHLTCLEVTPNPLAASLAAEPDGAVLGVDVVVASCAAARTQELLLARGVQLAVGAQGTARRALIAYVTDGLEVAETNHHAPDG